ncbi:MULTISPECIES: hypothetical protein [Nostocales]|nr:MULTISPECIES: hypothetical protein [Nostocales]MBD2299022.1 hypothetical protein [Nostoc sp. FACHB-190]MBD2488464.1 hypothetical protein [Aulosira sp. FACHB-615]
MKIYTSSKANHKIFFTEVFTSIILYSTIGLRKAIALRQELAIAFP